MKLLCKGSSKTLTVQAVGDVTEIAVTNLNIPSKLPYCDAGTLITGCEYVSVPVCYSKEDFVKAINKSKFVHLREEGKRFVLEDVSGVLKEAPAGVYEGQTVIKRMVLTKEANDTFKLQQYPDIKKFNETAGALLFKGGESESWNGDLHFGGTFTSSQLNNGKSLVFVTDATFNRNAIQTEVGQAEMGFVRAALQHELVTLKTKWYVYRWRNKLARYSFYTDSGCKFRDFNGEPDVRVYF